MISKKVESVYFEIASGEPLDPGSSKVISTAAFVVSTDKPEKVLTGFL